MSAVITDEEYKQLNWYRSTWFNERQNALRAEKNVELLRADLSTAQARIEQHEIDYCALEVAHDALEAKVAAQAAQLEQARIALTLISMHGGNLPDDRLTDKTGANDAVQRGLMYVASRSIAKEWLAAHPEPARDGYAVANEA